MLTSDLLDFTDLIGPGGKGLSKEDALDDDGFGPGSSDEEEEDDDGLNLDLNLGEDSEEEESEEDDDEEEGSGTDEEEDEDEDGEGESADDDGGSDEEAEEWHGIASSRGSSPAEADTAPAPVAEAPVPTKYVPPHLRAAALAEKAAGDKDKIEERRKLERKAQGLLNKLSEANMESILGEIEALFREHSRNGASTSSPYTWAD